MTAQAPPPAADSHDKEAGSADAVRSQPDQIAISPAIGPLPAIYVPRAPGESGPIGLLWHVTARAARLAGEWATRHLPHRHPATQDGEPRQPATPPGFRGSGIEMFEAEIVPIHGQPAARKPDGRPRLPRPGG
jgi:hypothetical protein